MQSYFINYLFLSDSIVWQGAGGRGKRGRAGDQSGGQFLETCIHLNNIIIFHLYVYIFMVLC